MIRRPPRSTLFPTRRSSDLMAFLAGGNLPDRGPHATAVEKALARSEEHTSELQSRRDLVCRLLLEKKKKNKQDRTQPEDKPLYHVPANTHTSCQYRMLCHKS